MTESLLATPRLRWMLDQVMNAFAPDLEKDEVVRLFRSSKHILQPFITDMTHPPKLFFFFQPRGSGKNPERHLFITVGDANETPRLKDKCVYFLRTTDKPVKTSVRSDDAVISGELNPNILSVLENTISSVFAPMLKKQDKWGKIDADQEKETFIKDLDTFTTDIKRSLKNLKGELILDGPQHPFDQVKQRPPDYARAAQDAELVKHFMQVVEGWCAKITRYITDDKSKVPISKNNDEGPDVEIDSWERRLPTLISIREQLKSKKNRVVTGVLLRVRSSDVPHDDNALFHEDHKEENALRDEVNQLWEKWTQVDRAITDALNEAKDNVRFLRHLRKVIQPIFHEPPHIIKEAMPAIMNSMKMIHTLSRHYGEEIRMTNLFERISNQLIKRCKEEIYGGRPKVKLWEQPPEELIATMKSCLDMFTTYVSEYETAKGKLDKMRLKDKEQKEEKKDDAATPDTGDHSDAPSSSSQSHFYKQFNFDTSRIFFKTTLFSRRLEKLIDMFSSIQQFQSLDRAHVDGMDTLIQNFENRITDFRLKHPEDLLNYNSTSFERDYVEYTMHNSVLENWIQDFMDRSIKQLDSIDKKLDLMDKFQRILHREALQEDLEQKYLEVFGKYGAELRSVAKLCETQWKDPPRPRNMAEHSGAILWARQLLQRIGSPMDKFRHHPKVFHNSQSKKIIHLYNRLVKALIQYQENTYKQWCELTDEAKRRLRAPLIVKDSNNRLHVNFDKDVLKLVRNAKHLHLMGYHIPNSARTVLLLEDRLKLYYNRIFHALQTYNNVTALVRPHIVRKLLDPHLKDLLLTLKPAMTRMNWTSMNIEAFLDDVHAVLSRFQLLVTHLTDIINNRIKKNMNFVSRLLLLKLPQKRGITYTLHEFNALQREHIAKCATVLVAKNTEIERAVDDFLEVVQQYHLHPSISKSDHFSSTLKANCLALKQHYARDMYRALLNCVRDSIAILKHRNLAPEATGQLVALFGNEFSTREPLFELELFVSGDVRFSPPLESESGANRGFSSSGAASSAGTVGSSQLEEKGADRAAPAAGDADKAQMESYHDIIVTVARQIILITDAVEVWDLDGSASPGSVVSSSSAATASDRSLGLDADDSMRGAGPSSGSGAPKKRKSFYEVSFSQDKHLEIAVLQLTGAIHNTKKAARHVLGRLLKWKTSDSTASTGNDYAFLWHQDVEEEYLKFERQYPGGNPGVHHFIAELRRFVDVEKHIEAIPEQQEVGAILLKTANLKEQLHRKTDEWKHQYSEKLHHQAKNDMEGLMEHMKELKTKLERKVENISSLKVVMDAQAELRDVQSSIDMQFSNILERYSILEDYLPSGAMTKEEMDIKSQLKTEWKSTLTLAARVMGEVTKVQGPYKVELETEVRDFKEKVKKFKEDYDEHGPMVKDISPEEAMTRLSKYKREFDTLNRKYEEYNGGEKLFGLPESRYPSLQSIGKDLENLKKLYDLYHDVITTIDGFKEFPWQGVIDNMEEMSAKVAGFKTNQSRLTKAVRTYDAYFQLKKKIDDFDEVLPMLEQLSQPYMKQRHWDDLTKALEERTGTSKEFDMDKFNDLKLREVLDVNLLEIKEEIEEITDAAEKQQSIQKKIDEIIGQWRQQPFEFGQWKERGMVILNGLVIGEVVEKLEESQASLVQMITMKHIAPFRAEADGWLKKLSEVNETLEQWVSVQQLWMSLEAVFTGGDIARQMPQDTRVFMQVDREWTTRLMPKAREVELVVECCLNEYIKSMLPQMKADLEKCQKALSGYLETKRGRFPRFYFVSDPALLLILSQGSDKEAVQGAFPKIFDSIDRVEFKGDHIVKIMTGDGGPLSEIIELTKPVQARGNIEDWLTELLKEMIVTIKDIVRRGAFECDGMLEWPDFIEKYIAQVSLLGIQFFWTKDVTDHLVQAKNDKKALDRAYKNQSELLTKLSDMTTQPIPTKTKRTKIETLVTIQVHQKDVLGELVDAKIRDVYDFDWQKQLRCYWEGDENEAVVRIADVDFGYCYEYLGVKERLVVTPLTDRCYISLSQALGMYFGGAPAGPAGTGKTETVKDLGRALGKYVVVFNCSDQMHTADTAKLFKGLSQSGSWGCFDEFNRIELEVLSVVAQQVNAILMAMRSANAGQRVPKRTEQFLFPGDDIPIPLDPRNGFFITMNPGYAGRQELPENLKALFRGVAMMVPDREIIIKVKLASVGYHNYATLAKKFRVLYRLCEEQLSKQRHYDFGLRNILSVLRTAGVNLRDELKKQSPSNKTEELALEEMLMMRTLRDMNLSKLVADDVGLFRALLQDLFPGRGDPEKMRYDKVEAAMRKVIAESGLIRHASWVDKIIQLYETSLVRHGLMMVGPAGGGKTVATRVLLEALSICQEEKTVMVRMNPKAITAEQMFGESDAISKEWTDGVFSALWAKYNEAKRAHYTWIVCDGPVDAIWIENLNTVLDDNKLLTLANGDRIPMSDKVRLLFEVQDLRNASPATVSRAGIVFVSSSNLGWEPLIEAWLLRRQGKTGSNAVYGSDDAERAGLQDLFDKYLKNEKQEDDTLLDWIRNNAHKVIPVMDQHLVVNLLNLFEGLLSEIDNEQLRANPEAVERVFLYSLSWSLGGLFEQKDREAFNEHLGAIGQAVMPKLSDNETLYEYFVDPETLEWSPWTPPDWEYPATNFKFSTCLIPTVDSVRAEKLIDVFLGRLNKPILITGGSGTAKTSIVLQYMQRFDDTESDEQMVLKKVGFSSATTPNMFQFSIEADIEKRQGRTFAPPAGRHMTVFLDDLSMPEVNKWGDQPTLEIVRQLIETGGFYFLEKDKRGERKIIEGMAYIAAMTHPGGGRNDIPNRLKRHFFTFNMTPPSEASIDNIYGSMLRGRYAARPDLAELVEPLTKGTIDLWKNVRQHMLPTPSKFHYIFNMRDLSRVFQGILHSPNDVLNKPHTLTELWYHECMRVFHDKLTNEKDQSWYRTEAINTCKQFFGDDAARQLAEEKELYFVDFLRDPEIDPDTDEILKEAEKIYERVTDVPGMRERVNEFLGKYNDTPGRKKMDLVLFTDALEHMMRIARIIGLPRGNALLVGVGGSGRQSLTRLAAFLAGHDVFQVQLSAGYKVDKFLEDIREQLYKPIANPKENKKITWIFTDFEILQEEFLEYINAILSTGEVAGLLPKEERDIMIAELRGPAKADDPVNFQDTPDYLYKYFINRVRDNLHVVLCFSPANEKFAERARRFPGLISGCTVDWFLRWPTEALVDVSTKFVLNDPEFQLSSTEQHKNQLVKYIAGVHNAVVSECDQYLSMFRRAVYVTPKSYLSFIHSYKKLYSKKLEAVQTQERNVKKGLAKLEQANSDVEKMKVELKAKKVQLKVAEEEAKKKVKVVREAVQIADEQRGKAEVIEAEASQQAKVISEQKAQADKELAQAQPLVEAAKKAASKVTDKDISVMKSLKAPSDLIKRIMDCVLILNNKPLDRVDTNYQLKNGDMWLKESWTEAQRFMAYTGFTRTLMDFAADNDDDPDFVSPKDMINEETMELLEPYINQADFNPVNAKKVSGAAEGLCEWCIAMFNYHNASKIVIPKLEKVREMTAHLDTAMEQLRNAQAESKAASDEVTRQQNELEETHRRRQELQADSEATQKKMKAAQDLIESLTGEKVRWKEDEKKFGTQKDRLIGDCAMACAFISYSGPFNSEFRRKLMEQRYYGDARERNIPVTKDLNLNLFLVDQAQIAAWNNQGLPKDDLSIQNGILVTKASRYPLLIDPQGQGLSWIMRKEASNFPLPWRTTTITDNRLRDKVEFCVQEGKPLLIEGIVQELDPMLDPVLEKNIQKKGSKGGYEITMSDGTHMEFNTNFRLYLITKLPNPLFSPELSAKTTIIDFSVTQRGLEDQLLSRVIQHEQAQLEEQKQKLNEEVNSYTINLQELDATLLTQLSESKGNLLDNTELIDTLANTKKQAKEVKEKISEAEDTERSINQKREQYRDVATRGSVLYFTIVDASNINVMYQNSLQQFLGWFDHSMDEKQVDDKGKSKVLPVKERVVQLRDVITFNVYQNINRSLFERDKLTFKLMATIKIMLTETPHLLNSTMVNLFLRGGAALADEDVVARPSSLSWLSEPAWNNVLALSRSLDFFRDIRSSITTNKEEWRTWYEAEAPETLDIPGGLEERLQTDSAAGSTHFFRMLLIRSLRDDRTRLAAERFVGSVLGHEYTQPMPIKLQDVLEDSDNKTPVIMLLTPGADPTQQLKDLSKRHNITMGSVSMGEGQEKPAQRLIERAMQDGGWALLQNCHLGLKFVSGLDEFLKRRFRPSEDSSSPPVHEDFRLWLTCEPHKDFPISLLQMSVKVTNEPPRGMKAGLVRSYTTVVDDDRINRMGDNKDWRNLIYSVCFLHSVVQERRKFGPVGWCIPYEFNTSDLDASLTFLENHFYATSHSGLSWKTIRYMICEVQYGGRITDDFDRVLFNTFGHTWLQDQVSQDNFQLCRVGDSAHEFKYIIPPCVDTDGFLQYIRSFPDHDSPEIFGLHQNADLTFGSAEAKGILDTIADTQPKETASSSGGLSRDEEVTAMCKKLLAEMKESTHLFGVDQLTIRARLRTRPKEELQKLAPDMKSFKGVNAFEMFPLNVFLFQEIVRLQGVMGKVHSTLSDLIQAIKGEIIMTPELQQASDAIFDGKPPTLWYQDAGGALTAWVLPSLAMWFKGMLDREKQLESWLNTQRPKSYWLTGFFNPQGFLTAMRQEVTRRHKSGSNPWALDDVEIVTDVEKVTLKGDVTYLTKEAEKQLNKLKQDDKFEGVYIHGLYLEGCGWDEKGTLVESKPKELHVSMPVLHVYALDSKKANDHYKKTDSVDYYNCPVYTRPRRTDLAYVFDVKLPTQVSPTVSVDHWTMRGVALLCSKD